MKQFIYLFSGLLLLFASTPRVVAQEIGDYSQLNDEDYSKIDLPPLSVLFENAKNNPIYELADAKTAIERKLLQKEKWAFLGFFSLRGSYQYGMFGNESTYTDRPILWFRWQSSFRIFRIVHWQESGFHFSFEELLSAKWPLTTMGLTEPQSPTPVTSDLE